MKRIQENYFCFLEVMYVLTIANYLKFDTYQNLQFFILPKSRKKLYFFILFTAI